MLSANVVEHAVKNNAYAVSMESGTDLGEILVCSKASVNELVVGGVIAMSGRLKYRSEINCIYMHSLQVRNPFDDLLYSMDRRTAQLGTSPFTAAEAERIDVIYSGFFDPFR